MRRWRFGLLFLAVSHRLIPFLNQFEIRREAADSAIARQGEAKTYRIDLEMELGVKSRVSPRGIYVVSYFKYSIRAAAGYSHAMENGKWET